MLAEQNKKNNNKAMQKAKAKETKKKNEWINKKLRECVCTQVSEPDRIERGP